MELIGDCHSVLINSIFLTKLQSFEMSDKIYILSVALPVFVVFSAVRGKKPASEIVFVIFAAVEFCSIPR